MCRQSRGRSSFDPPCWCSPGCQESWRFPECLGHNPTEALTTEEHLIGEKKQIYFPDIKPKPEIPVKSQLTIESDLKGSSGQKMSLHHVTEEVGHQTGEDLPNSHWNQFNRWKFKARHLTHIMGWPCTASNKKAPRGGGNSSTEYYWLLLKTLSDHWHPDWTGFASFCQGRTHRSPEWRTTTFKTLSTCEWSDWEILDNKHPVKCRTDF